MNHIIEIEPDDSGSDPRRNSEQWIDIEGAQPIPPSELQIFQSTADIVGQFIENGGLYTAGGEDTLADALHMYHGTLGNLAASADGPRALFHLIPHCYPHVFPYKVGHVVEPREVMHGADDRSLSVIKYTIQKEFGYGFDLAVPDKSLGIQLEAEHVVPLLLRYSLQTPRDKIRAFEHSSTLPAADIKQRSFYFPFLVYRPLSDPNFESDGIWLATEAARFMEEILASSIDITAVYPKDRYWKDQPFHYDSLLSLVSSKKRYPGRMPILTVLRDLPTDSGRFDTQFWELHAAIGEIVGGKPGDPELTERFTYEGHFIEGILPIQYISEEKYQQASWNNILLMLQAGSMARVINHSLRLQNTLIGHYGMTSELASNAIHMPMMAMALQATYNNAVMKLLNT